MHPLIWNHANKFYSHFLRLNLKWLFANTLLTSFLKKNGYLEIFPNEAMPKDFPIFPRRNAWRYSNSDYFIGSLTGSKPNIKTSLYKFWVEVPGQTSVKWRRTFLGERRRNRLVDIANSICWVHLLTRCLSL